ncbi:MAG: hypothetical protein LIO46_00945 [Clostridiales bacterium]|nr:hypothetical protein [Clostridiales bacterium]
MLLKRALLCMGLVSAAVCMLIAGCSREAGLELEDLSGEEAQVIADALEEQGIFAVGGEKVNLIGDEGEALLAQIMEEFDIYDLETADGGAYRIVLDASDKTLRAVIDLESRTYLYGSLFDDLTQPE